MTTEAKTHREVPRWVTIVALVACLAIAGGLLLWSMRGPGQADAPQVGPNNSAPPQRDIAARQIPGNNERPGAIVAMGSDPGPTLVSLSMKDAEPADVAAELARQSGLNISYFREPGEKVSIAADKQPFWAVANELCRKMGREPVWRPQAGDRIELNSARAATRPACVSGSFLVRVTKLEHRAQVLLPDTQAVSHSARAELELMCEPKLAVFGCWHAAVLEEATDELGHSLIDASQTGVFTESSAWRMTSSAFLNLSPEAGRRIAKLKGHIAVVVAAKSDTLNVPDVAAAKEVSQSLNGVDVNFQGMSASGSEYTVKLLVAVKQRPQLQWWYYRVRTHGRLLDEKGQAYRCTNVEFGSNDRPELVIRYSRGVTDQTAPARFVLTAPVMSELQEIDVPFVFEDLPMP